MIDLHSHILFAVDDGPASAEESRQLLLQAYEQGVRTIVATPHQRKGMFEASLEDIQARWQDVQQLAHQVAPGLTIELGVEVYYSISMLERLEQGLVPSLAQSRVVLLEFAYGLSYKEIVRAIRAIQLLGYQVLIAHLERYDAFHKQDDLVREIRKLGCLIQVNAGSLLPISLFDKRKTYKKRARQLLDTNLVDCIASDAHHVEYRPYYMAQAYDFVSKRYGSDRAQRLFHDVPAKILEKGRATLNGN